MNNNRKIIKINKTKFKKKQSIILIILNSNSHNKIKLLLHLNLIVLLINNNKYKSSHKSFLIGKINNKILMILNITKISNRIQNKNKQIIGNNKIKIKIKMIIWIYNKKVKHKDLQA